MSAQRADPRLSAAELDCIRGREPSRKFGVRVVHCAGQSADCGPAARRRSCRSAACEPDAIGHDELRGAAW